MQYNPDCDQPRCYLSLENGKEEPRSLQEIQVRGLSISMFFMFVLSCW